jgi:NAD(P)-dependent dehydrogenase (short-subunit alcohol dehydrogenase family)
MSCAIVVGNTDGVGLALSELLLARGWEVIGISRRPSALRAARYEHHVLDVCDLAYGEQLAKLVAMLDARQAELQACVYCAGIGEFLDLDDLSRERRVFETNLLGAVTTASVIMPALLRARRGHFIGLSSQADALIDPNAPSYAASKAGLSSYLEGLALACRPRGVFVTNLRFGFIDTKMAKARVRPFMLTRDEAARRVWHCLQARPVRDTFPRSMAMLLWFFRMGSLLRRWLPRR